MIAPKHVPRSIALTISTCTLALILVACGDQKQAGFGPPPVPVETADVASTMVTDRLDAVGNVEAADAITVVSEIDAKVVKLPFTEGQYIDLGGLIAQLDDSQTRAEVASAEATQVQARVTYERVKEIVDAGAAAEQELDDATAALKIAEATLEQANVRLSKTRIEAPFSGVLGTRQVSPGAYLRAGDAITTLTKISTLRISFAAPERTFPYLERGSAVTVTSPAYPEYQLEGKIEVVDPVVNESTRSVRIIALVPNKERRLRPGMSASVSAVLRSRPNALVIPDEAIFSEGSQTFVYTVKPDSTVVRTAVTLGARQTGTVEVTQGLTAGQVVVRAGHQKLFDGARVTPVQSNPQETINGSGPSVDPASGDST